MYTAQCYCHTVLSGSHNNNADTCKTFPPIFRHFAEFIAEIIEIDIYSAILHFISM